MRRAQAAMEFLTTYGWAILIILVVLGALYLSVIVNTKTPPTCIFQTPEFSCYTYKLTSNSSGDGGIILLLYNAKHDVRVTGFNCTTSEEWVLTDFQQPGDNVTISAGEYKTLKGDTTTPLPLPCWKTDGTKVSAQDAGQYYKGNIYVHYIDLETNTNHSLVGHVSGTIE